MLMIHQSFQLSRKDVFVKIDKAFAKFVDPDIAFYDNKAIVKLLCIILYNSIFFIFFPVINLFHMQIKLYQHRKCLDGPSNI